MESTLKVCYHQCLKRRCGVSMSRPMQCSGRSQRPPEWNRALAGSGHCRRVSAQVEGLQVVSAGGTRPSETRRASSRVSAGCLQGVCHGHRLTVQDRHERANRQKQKRRLHQRTGPCPRPAELPQIRQRHSPPSRRARPRPNQQATSTKGVLPSTISKALLSHLVSQ